MAVANLCTNEPPSPFLRLSKTLSFVQPTRFHPPLPTTYQPKTARSFRSPASRQHRPHGRWGIQSHCLEARGRSEPVPGCGFARNLKKWSAPPVYGRALAVPPAFSAPNHDHHGKHPPPPRPNHGPRILGPRDQGGLLIELQCRGRVGNVRPREGTERPPEQRLQDGHRASVAAPDHVFDGW